MLVLYCGLEKYSCFELWYQVLIICDHTKKS